MSYNVEAIVRSAIEEIVERIGSAGSAPVFTLQPQSQSVESGGTITFTWAASGSPAPTFQVQRSINSGATWADVSGATTSPYTTPALPNEADGYQYRVIATGTGATVSSVATVTVLPTITLTIPAAKQAGAFSNGVYPIVLPEMDGISTTGRDVVLTDDADATLEYAFIAKNHIALLDGVWSFYGGPCVLLDPDAGVAGQIYTNGVTTFGSRNLSAYDVDAKTFTRYVLNAANNEIDDHNHAGMAINNDGKLVVAYTHHPGQMRIRVANTAHDLTGGFAAEVVPADMTQCSYAWLFNLSAVGAGGTLVLFTRNHTTRKDWWVSKSTDGGATWSALTQAILTDTDNNYPQMWSDDTNNIWIVFNETQPNSTPRNRGIYCVRYDGTNFHTPSGVNLGTQILETADITGTAIVYPHTGPGRRSVTDIMTGPDGRPRILFVEYTDADETYHVLWHGRFNGSAWVLNAAVDEGRNFMDPSTLSESYPGVGKFNRSNINQLATAVTVGSYKEIQIFETTNNGATWSKTVDVTTGSLKNNFRPHTPHGLTAEVAALPQQPHWFWCGNGDYSTFLDLGTAIKCYPANYTYGALVKLDFDGVTDVDIRVKWKRSPVAETLELFDDLAVGFAHFGTMRFNDYFDAPESYLTSGYAKSYVAAYSLGIEDGQGWPRFVCANDLGRMQFAPNYRNAGEVTNLFYGRTTNAATQQHLVSNNNGTAPMAILRHTTGNKAEMLIYQTSAFATITSTPSIGTTDNLLVGVFDRDGATRYALRINETSQTGTALDQNLNDSADTPTAAVGQRAGALQGTGLTGNFAMAVSGTVALSKVYTDTLYRALSDPATFAVEA